MIEAVILEGAKLFLPSVLAFVSAKIKDGASTDVALMQAIAKLEDTRAQAKFGNFKGSDLG